MSLVTTQTRDQQLVFKTDYRLMQVKSIAECSNGSILQYFRPSLSYHLSLRYLFCLFMSGRLRQVLLYVLFFWWHTCWLVFGMLMCHFLVIFPCSYFSSSHIIIYKVWNYPRPDYVLNILVQCSHGALCCVFEKKQRIIPCLVLVRPRKIDSSPNMTEKCWKGINTHKKQKSITLVF